MTIEQQLKAVIRDVPDFPKPGILFKDISTIMLDAKVSNAVLDHLVAYYQDKGLDAIAGIESRGFLFGYPLAMRLGLPFVLIRKEGKLPYDKIKHAYELEYGSAVIEMHADAVEPGQRVLIHDDLLATGGSAAAAATLIERAGATVAGFSFLVALDFLEGDKVLQKF
ncbi:MAG: adenine phosphoribosyltransferase, partial [Crocinitomicaceae bacterium]